jgi:integrating conjugative element protein (TIGR03755 family)
LIQEEFETRFEALRDLVTGDTPTTFENLAEAGTASLSITRGVIEALRDEPDQDILARRLASEVALASVMEKALLLQRTLLAGRKEPNVAANQLAQDAVTRESDLLAQEINNLMTELEVRRELAANSPMAIIQRHSSRSEVSRGVYQGDTERNRLDAIQQVPDQGNPP